MTRDCKRCGKAFEVDRALDARIRARFGEVGHGHLVCAICVLKAIDDFDPALDDELAKPREGGP